MRSVKLALRIILSLAMSGVFIWLSVRGTDMRAVAGAIARADPARILIYALLLLLIHVARTVRWGILLEPLGHVGFRRLNSASAVGIMLLLLLPLRLGEFARPLLIARPPEGKGPRLRRSGAFASIVVERITDGLFVGLLGVIALRVLGAGASGQYANFVRHAATLVTAGFSVLCLALVLAFFLRERAVWLARKALTPLSPRLAERATSMLDAFISALHLGSGWKVLGFFALTALYWGINAFGLTILAPAFGLHLDLLQACTVLASQVVGVMVPAGPGMVGTLQFFTQIGLSLFVPGAFTDPAVRVSSAAFANTCWLLLFGQQVAVGMVFMLSGHVSLRGLFSSNAEPELVEQDASAAAAPDASAPALEAAPPALDARSARR